MPRTDARHALLAPATRGASLLLIATLAAATLACAAPNRASRTNATQPAASSSPAAAASPSASPSATPTETSTSTATATSTTTTTANVAASAADRGTASRPQSAPAVAEPTPAATPAPVPPSTGGEAPRRPRANAASAGFPAPPAKYVVSPPNSGGVARIVSSKFGLDHYVDVLGVVNNEMEAPDHDGSYAVGWYRDFSKPGEPGNAVFSAHETWNHYQGPFYWMYTAEVGDEITLDMASGHRYVYQVISAARYTVDNIPMLEVLYPPTRGADEEYLTLITCGGAIVYHGAFGDYVDRDIVVLKRVR